MSRFVKLKNITKPIKKQTVWSTSLCHTTILVSVWNLDHSLSSISHFQTHDTINPTQLKSPYLRSVSEIKAEMLSFGQSSHGFKKVRAFESIAVLRARTARGQRPAFSQAPQVQIKQRVHQIQCQSNFGLRYQSAIGIFVWLCYIRVFNGAIVQ